MNRIFYALIIILQLLPNVLLAEDQPSEYTNPEKIRADLDRLEQYVHRKLGLNDLEQPTGLPKPEAAEKTASIYEKGDLSHLHSKLDDQNTLVANLMDRIERLEHQDDIFGQSTQKKNNEIDQLKEHLAALQGQLDIALLEIEKLKKAGESGPKEQEDPKEKSEDTPTEKIAPKPVEENKNVDLDGKSPEEIFDLGEKTLKAADYQTAQNIFDQYVELDGDKPSTSKAHYYLGEICNLTKQPAKASEHYLKSFQLDTSGDHAAESLVKLGSTLHAGGKAKAGCAALEKARTEYPEMTSSSKSLLYTKFKECKCQTS
tara:strand:+ start:3794 stop:4741 length:948 start_codon:yes stop_codon:yes gene_type:complete